MPDAQETVTFSVLNSILDIPAGQWDALAGQKNPFTSHAFLAALETSGSVAPRTGWSPQHLIALDETGRPRAAAPLYLKSHSYGEYVFDQSWAEAYQRAGGRYYPKLQCAVPFTPVAGPRLLTGPDKTGKWARALTSGMIGLAERLGVSSLHVTFPGEADWTSLRQAGFLARIDRQFHWKNNGYGSFADFLNELSSRKRKAIAKERRKVFEYGVTFRAVTGSDIGESDWDAFYSFYRNTSDRKWGRSYLTRDFFSILGRDMPGQTVLILAEYGGRPVAGALNLLGPHTLYGRYWGAEGAYKLLHFETCYYRAMDFAIDRGLSFVEAGAQGEHKISRGYLPAKTYSAHWIAETAFRDAVSHYLENEVRAVEAEIEDLLMGSPFKKA